MLAYIREHQTIRRSKESREQSQDPPRTPGRTVPGRPGGGPERLRAVAPLAERRVPLAGTRRGNQSSPGLAGLPAVHGPVYSGHGGLCGIRAGGRLPAGSGPGHGGIQPRPEPVRPASWNGMGTAPGDPRHDRSRYDSKFYGPLPAGGDPLYCIHQVGGNRRDPVPPEIFLPPRRPPAGGGAGSFPPPWREPLPAACWRMPPPLRRGNSGRRRRDPSEAWSWESSWARRQRRDGTDCSCSIPRTWPLSRTGWSSSWRRVPGKRGKGSCPSPETTRKPRSNRMKTVSSSSFIREKPRRPPTGSVKSSSAVAPGSPWIRIPGGTWEHSCFSGR
jgi:hypothetical protein